MEWNTALHEHSGAHKTSPSRVGSHYTLERAFSPSRKLFLSPTTSQSHTETEMFGLCTTVVFCWWTGIRCESICTQAQHDFIAPCLAYYTQFLGDGLCLVPACCEDGDCIVTPALFMLVVARNATPCLAAAGCAAISKCLFNEKLCEMNLTTECDIPVPCTDEEWLAEPSPYSAFDYLCAQEVEDTIIENGDCFDCDLCVPAVGRADCTAKSGCFWCANNSGCADAVAAEREDLTSLSGFVFNDPALPRSCGTSEQ